MPADNQRWRSSIELAAEILRIRPFVMPPPANMSKLQGEIFAEDESGHQPNPRGNSKKQQWGEVKQGASPSRTGTSSGHTEFDQLLLVACARFERLRGNDGCI